MYVINYRNVAGFRYALVKYLKAFEEAAKNYGVTYNQYNALIAIEGYPERNYVSPIELCERLELRHNSCSALLNRCEKLGLVEKFNNPNDKRSYYYKLTEKGKDTLFQVSNASRNLAKHTKFMDFLIDNFEEFDNKK